MELLMFLLFALAVALLGYVSERKDWNGGFSKIGKPWVRFDTDSQGGRGYKDGRGNYCWISWPGIDKTNG